MGHKLGHVPAYLMRRGSLFYYRQRVPASLIGTLGRSEIRQSLRTGNLREAHRIRAAFGRSDKLRSGELLDAVKDALRCGRDVAYAAVTTAVNDGVLHRHRVGNAQIYSLAA